MDCITFTKTTLPYGWMGNMSPYPVTYDNKEWRTTEALFHALRLNEEADREKIRMEKSPMGAKFAFKAILKGEDKLRIQMLSKEDLDNMIMCVRLKLECHPHLKDELLVTGDLPIYEDVTARGRKGNNLFWGALRTQDGWEGKNMLGRIWMMVRSEIRDSDSNSIL